MPISLSTPCDLNLECVSGCDSLPEVSFSLCNPQVNSGEVCQIMLTSLNNPMINETDSVEWATRMALPQEDPSRIILLRGVGEKPEAPLEEIVGAYNNTASALRSHQVEFVISQTGDLNYEMLRYYERAKKGLGWYLTRGGRLYGGKGIPFSIGFSHVIPRENSALETITAILKWDYKFHPCRQLSVI